MPLLMLLMPLLMLLAEDALADALGSRASIRVMPPVIPPQEHHEEAPRVKMRLLMLLRWLHVGGPMGGDPDTGAAYQDQRPQDRAQLRHINGERPLAV